MTSFRAALAGIALATMAPSAYAATITLDAITTPIAYNTQVTAAPKPIASGVGSTIATGLLWSGGEGLGAGLADDFLAWCFDLIHPVGLGVDYEYEVVDTPYSNSYLLDGADTRVSSLINANYDSLDATDHTQAAAFQIAVWEVANDDDFDITSGVFQASGLGKSSADISKTAQTFLSRGANFAGPETWRAMFLETRESIGTQNLVTAVRTPDVAPVPLPAPGLLLLGGLAGLAAMRRR